MAKKKAVRKVKAKEGRPTKYRKAYCEKLIEHLETGLSFESFAGVVSVSKQTIYDWEKAHSEFLDAKREGMAKCQLWWEKQGIKGLYKTIGYDDEGNRVEQAINNTVWIFNMKNRFAWRDKQPGEEDRKLTIDDISKQSDEELDERIKQLLENQK